MSTSSRSPPPSRKRRPRPCDYWRHRRPHQDRKPYHSPCPDLDAQCVRQGAEQHLTLRAAQDLITRLEHELQAGQEIHVTLSWIIEEGGPTQ